MSRPQDAHLSDEQFGDLLAGLQPSAEAAGHVQSCELCRGELEAVGVAVQELSVASAEWAQRTAPRRIGVLSWWERTLGGRVPWMAGIPVTALAGLLAFGLSLHQRAEPAPVRPVAVAAAPSSSALADDNRLLLSISQELNDRTETTGVVADAQESDHGTRAPNADAVVN